jgi:hypothetical protein
MHDCEVPGCGRRIARERFLCPWHWRQVPRPLQDAVWATWKRRLAASGGGIGPGRDRYAAAAAAHEQAKADALAALGGAP